MRIVIVSDTHGKFGQIRIPDGDMLIHCGDITVRGTPGQIEGLNRELNDLPHKHKIVVAGNHDFPLEIEPSQAQKLLPAATYLQDQLVEIEGLKIYGSPWQPDFQRGAFNLPRSSDELAAKWAMIPDELDILVTHGPPAGILDWTPHSETVGDELLLARVLAVSPRLHCFGHVHQSNGVKVHEGITFANGACLDGNHEPNNSPIVVDL